MNDDEKRDELWDVLLDYEIASEAELRLATALIGYSLETLESVLYVKTGYRSLEQFQDARGQDDWLCYQRLNGSSN